MSTSKGQTKFRYRATPQLSASQMAEYVESSSTRRTSIIREAKYPKTSQVAHYDQARSGLTAFLCDGTRSGRHFADAIDYLNKRERRADATDWIKRDNRLSIEAIEAFQKHYNRFDLRKLDCRAVVGRPGHLILGPTRISVAMNCTIHKPADPTDLVGGAMLLFSRGEGSSKRRKERSKTIAGLIYTYADRHMKTFGQARPDLCLAVDVFGGVAHPPPGTFARGLRTVEDACVEIADRWPKISPPDDYDGPDPT